MDNNGVRACFCRLVDQVSYKLDVGRMQDRSIVQLAQSLPGRAAYGSREQATMTAELTGDICLMLPRRSCVSASWELLRTPQSCPFNALWSLSECQPKPLSGISPWTGQIEGMVYARRGVHRLSTWSILNPCM